MPTITPSPYQLQLGHAQSFRGLALVPLFNPSEPVLEYIGLDEAVARGLSITEVDHSGSVNTLLVANPTDANALLFEGEELVGAKQNRVLDRTFLVAAGAKQPVPVNCVEHGRWSYRSNTFAPAPRAAHPTGRYSARVGGQSGVWSEIAAKSQRLDAFSPTDAADVMYDKHASSLDEYSSALPRQTGQCGAIVCLAGRVVCLDFVSRSEVYAGLYAKLLRGYALDAVEQPIDAPLPTEYIDRLLARLPRASRGATGELQGRGFIGSELGVDGEPIALSVFPSGRA